MADNATTKQTIVEEETVIEGTIRSKCPVRISGQVKGEIGAPSLVVTATGSVHGQVKVADLKSEGELSGQIEAESVELSGRVKDQTAIRAATLEVKLAQNDGKLQVTFGACELQIGDRNAKQETRVDAKADPKAEPKHDVKTEAKPDAKAEPKYDVKSEAKPDGDVDRKNLPPARAEKR